MAVGDVYVFPGFLTPVQTQISFQSNQLLFSHASEEVRGKNMPQKCRIIPIHTAFSDDKYL